MPVSLEGRSGEELQAIIDHTDAVFGELAGALDSDVALADAMRILLQSETTVEDFVVLLTAEPELGRNILLSSMSALVNVHSMVAVRAEQQQRAAK